MTGVRRSGRIARQIPIVLLGTDTAGRVFCEETHTLVLSRHGAGILSRHRFAPDETLTIRHGETGRTADIRLVGHLGDAPAGYVYGVEFRDPLLDFWQIEFPPATDFLSEKLSTELECCFCGERETVEQSEIESDVFLASQLVLRYCRLCGQTTSWKLAVGASTQPRQKEAPPLSAMTSQDLPTVMPATIPAAQSAPLIVAPQPSSYAGSSILADLTTTATATLSTASSLAPASSSVSSVALDDPPVPVAKPDSSPQPSSGPRPNRRKHVRTRVHFTACVRINFANEEIVECDNISKGGLCFRSRKKYLPNAAIEVAVPYEPGQTAIFVPARICRIEELPALHAFRYGVAYT